MKLLKVLANLNRKKILQLCKEPMAVAVLERSLGISHGYLWKNINLLQKNKLIKLYYFFIELYNINCGFLVVIYDEILDYAEYIEKVNLHI